MPRLQGVGGKEDAGGVECGGAQTALRAGGGWGQALPGQLIQTKLLLFSPPLPAAAVISEQSKPGFPPEFAVNCSVHTHPYALHPPSPTSSHQIQSFC